MGAAPTRLLLASHNAGKLGELRALLSDMPVELCDALSLGLPVPEEPAATFVENALLKARHCARLTGLPTLADDSGLMVDALGGGPGLHTARYAGPGASAQDNIAKLLAALGQRAPAERGATFVAVVVFLESADDPLPLIAQGLWRGRILDQPTGSEGFGYDPIFFDPVHDLGAAQMAAELKDRISHRGQALAALRTGLVERFGLSPG
ncbi:MAG: RdgB/HAM1 family non-canonical purine NTP pyrophosphatase [Xanthomonadales bacterium]|nr:RdgB/HAM1 family non-canonical purine NTP pyrophosphatase [Xanthomonadales bacterium]MCB1987548.1 RdgB/HAM1 family non-canonical purine NTP pyrophosphatase [Burkholderiaceae bacterium]